VEAWNRKISIFNENISQNVLFALSLRANMPLQSRGWPVGSFKNFMNFICYFVTWKLIERFIKKNFVEKEKIRDFLGLIFFFS
jgi:hypothetical protein